MQMHRCHSNGNKLPYWYTIIAHRSLARIPRLAQSLNRQISVHLLPNPVPPPRFDLLVGNVEDYLDGRRTIARVCSGKATSSLP